MRFLFIIIFLSLPFISIAQPQLIAEIHSDTNLCHFGRTIVSIGDQNDDGLNDILTWRYRYNGFLFYGGNPPDAQYDLSIDSVSSGITNIGDLNNDGYSDFCMSRRTSDGRFKLNLFYGGLDIDGEPDFVFGNDTLYGLYHGIYCNDININGTPELIAESNHRGSLVLFELGSSMDSIPDLEIFPANLEPYIDYDGFGWGLISGDFNGDSYCDFAVNFRPRRQDQRVGEVWFYWGGPQFDTLPDAKIVMPSPWTGAMKVLGVCLQIWVISTATAMMTFLPVRITRRIPYIVSIIPDRTLTQLPILL